MTIEELAEDINMELKEADSSTLIRPILIHIRDVYRRIGFGYMCKIEEVDQAVSNGKFTKSKDIISIIDIGDECGNYNSKRIGTGHHAKGLAYLETLTTVTFPNGGVDKVKLKYYALDKDEEGVPVINDAVYSALKEYCIAELLNSRYEHPEFKNRLFRKQNADMKIDQTRAEFSRSNDSSDRFRRNWFKQ
jgi:hypothetical protein